MCGRACCALSPEEVEAAFGVHGRWRDKHLFRQRHNAMPGAWTPVMRTSSEDDQPVLQTMAWGLVPWWTKQEEKPDHFKMFNARVETLTEKSVFSRLLRGNRCVVVMSGFYEWKKDAGGRKQPHYVHLCAPEGGDQPRPMFMAGLYDKADRPDGDKLYTYTMVTVPASKRFEWLHDRMPALLPDAEAAHAWLRGGSASQHEAGKAGDAGSSSPAQLPAQQLVDLLCRPYQGSDLRTHPVTPDMSNPSYDKLDACKDIRAHKGAITNFFRRSPKGLQPGGGGEGTGAASPAGKAPGLVSPKCTVERGPPATPPEEGSSAQARQSQAEGAGADCSSKRKPEGAGDEERTPSKSARTQRAASMGVSPDAADGGATQRHAADDAVDLT